MDQIVTLGDIQKLPFFSARDFSSARLRDSSHWVFTRKVDLGEAIPEYEALDFYLLNHAWADIKMKFHPEQPLPPEVAEVALNYAHRGAAIAERMYSYLLLICTRESRHCKSLGSAKLNLESKFGYEIYNFMLGIYGLGYTEAVNSLKGVAAPDVTLGKYTSAVEHMFFKGSWGGGYGGKAWGEVAKALRRFVHGEISAEMLVDTGWTLAHNNGPIFNKGMLYKHYDNDLKVLLDVQRSGQIPQFVREIGAGMKYIDRVSFEHVSLVTEIEKLKLSPAWDGNMDWDLVEKLGSTQIYPGFKNMAAQQFGTKAKMVPLKKKPVFEDELFYVSPGVAVKKTTRAEVMLTK